MKNKLKEESWVKAELEAPSSPGRTHLVARIDGCFHWDKGPGFEQALKKSVAGSGDQGRGLEFTQVQKELPVKNI